MAACARCRQDVPAGSRWCPICHSNVTRPEVGQLASPGKRLAAYVFDLAIPLAAFFLVIPLLAGGTVVAAFEAGLGEDAVGGTALAGVLGLVTAYALWALVLFARGTTPGKRVLRMYVFKESGERAGFFTMLFREWIGKWISAAVFFLGFLWILLDKDRQGWHDKLASTYIAVPSRRGSVSPPGPSSSSPPSSGVPAGRGQDPRPNDDAGLNSASTGGVVGKQQSAGSTTGADSRISAKSEAATWAAGCSDPADHAPSGRGTPSGVQASQVDPEVLSCGSCGTSFREEARFCAQCGAARDGVDTVAPNTHQSDDAEQHMMPGGSE